MLSWLHQGMLRSSVVGPFYCDLMNAAFKTTFAIYHRRFSTNTTPKWPLAQPFRVLGHNGAPHMPVAIRPLSVKHSLPFDKSAATMLESLARVDGRRIGCPMSALSRFSIYLPPNLTARH